MHIVEIESKNNTYSFDYLTCYEKPMALALSVFSEFEPNLFLLYLKTIQSYHMKNFQEENIIIPDFEDTIQWIIEEKMKKNLTIEDIECDEIFIWIEQQIEKNIPVMLTVNLKELFYSQYYKETDWPYLMLINGYDAEKKLFYVIDTTQTEYLELKEGQVYEQFVITYEMASNMIQSYKKVMKRAYAATITNSDNNTATNTDKTFLSEFLDFYCNAREEQPFKELTFMNEILDKVKEGKVVKRSSIFELTNHVEFLFTRTLSYKEFLYKLLSDYMIHFVEKEERYITIEKELISSWKKCLNTASLGMNLNREFDPERLSKKACEQEKEMLCTIMNGLSAQKDSNQIVTAHKKLNEEDAISEKTREIIKTTYEEPQTDIEKELQEFWQTLFKKQRIGVLDNFFDLGGNSLTGVKIQATVIKKFNVELPMDIFFTAPTIRELSMYIEENKNRNLFVPIEIAPKSERYILSSAQKRLFIMNQFEPDSTVYNIMLSLEVKGAVNTSLAESCLNEVIMRHDSLRTNFQVIEGTAYQVIRTSLEVKAELAFLEPWQIDDYLEQIDKPFRLDRDALIRLHIIHIAVEHRTILCFTAHHIVVDGTSFGIIVKEFAELYNNRKLDDVKLQYKDFTIWQEQQQQGEKYRKQIDYWVNKMKDRAPMLNLPYDFAKNNTMNSTGDILNFKINQELTKKIELFSKENETTLFMVLFGIVNIVLHKYSSQEDIIIGTPIADRPHVDLQDMVGMFVNMMPLRNFPNKNKKFRDFLREVRNNALEAFENQDCQFDVLIEELGLKGNTINNPMFNVVFILQNMDLSDVLLEKEIAHLKQLKNKTSKFDITIELMQVKDGIECLIEYSTELFKVRTIERLAQHFINCISYVLQNPDTRIWEIDCMGIDEKKQLLFDFNHTKKEYHFKERIFDQFIKQVDENGEAIAVEWNGLAYTYKQLSEDSSRIANTLVEAGLQIGEAVGVFLERSYEMIAAVMGIVCAGGVYIPLEPYLPDDRVLTIWENLNVKFIITYSKELQRILELTEEKDLIHKVLSMSELDEDTQNKTAKKYDKYIYSKQDIWKRSMRMPDVNVSPEDLAYIIFTSGSTGNPKGVMIQHTKAVNLIEWVNKTFQISPKDKVLAVTSISFDLSVYDIFGLLSAGGTIYMTSREELMHPKELLQTIVEKKITFWNSAPQTLMQLEPFFDETNAKEHCLSHVFLSGDWIPVSLPDRIKQTFSGVEVISLGGATEATVWSNYYIIDEVKSYWKSIPYGKPIQNAAYYILDSNLMLLPVGIPGDLYIGGDCLALGYFNEPELTKKQFISNPFVEGEIIYKTGDLAKWHTNGNMEFLGRADTQVKIRGFRVELGEIEGTLLKYPGIKEAVVIAGEEKWQEKKLYAFFTSSKEITYAELKEFLLKKLPDYFIPDVFIPLENFPVTANGKLDRKKLLEHKKSEKLDTGVKYVKPQNQTEELLLFMWKEELEIQNIGVNDNFFDIGGNSIKFIQFTNKLKEKMNVDIPVVQLFQDATVSGISKILLDIGNNIKKPDNPDKQISKNVAVMKNKINLIRKNK
ncbi:non-ribosomal peptide synthetase [Anaeromicropila populeti]|uniref:Amino acid adenylation domain-containing protein n=1 Tax=Anaeromicropila populeti TaxID=37658 RepID=A0A1I6L0J5_9FIRM|nr:non-ribosomal peptide synthetase [Anaeromicropila populeti]SFR96999.1 amino acid adenylation domain-containing protein [Anaeromicropila populeti]